MKKLILAAVLAGSMVVMAEEKTSAAPAAPVAAETAKRARPKLTEERVPQLEHLRAGELASLGDVACERLGLVDRRQDALLRPVLAVLRGRLALMV